MAIKSVNLAKLNKKLKDNLYCEIEILKGLHHPHIVALIDCRESASHIHLMMEYCELGDLSYFIKKRDKLADNPTLTDMIRKYPMPVDGGLNEVIVRHFFKQLASAMEFLRDRGFIHRDVKPQNLLLLPSPDWMAKRKGAPEVMTASKEPIVPMVGINSLPMLKLADFGFARSLPSTSLAETLCGSPLYMAPEILRYEKYDARADLWSIGTVLYEMMTGKPPFRASNHVELLRRIEQNEDGIRFSSKAVISREMKEIVRGFLKRKPDDRITFQEFFAHPVVTGPIPGLVGEDRPKEIITPSRSPEASIARHPSLRDCRPGDRTSKHFEIPYESSIPRDLMEQSPRTPSIEANQPFGTPGRQSGRPGSSGRPSAITAATAPNLDTMRQRDRAERNFTPLGRPRSRKPSYDEQEHLQVQEETRSSDSITEAEQAVRDAREYVLVEKKAVEVNAFADEMAASPRLTHANQMTKQLSRRNTTMGAPNSTSGAVAAPPSRTVQKAQGNTRPDTSARNSYGPYGKTSSSPSTTSAIAKALQGASVRVFGVSWSPTLIGKGPSPQQLYNPYPAYPTPNTGLIGDARPIDEDQRVVNAVEDSATRSDVVYGFAEVKYRQLIPLAPSMDHGIGGPIAEKVGDTTDEDDGLTVEAIVSLSEEALVLYVKSLSLLAKSMDIASAWWARKNRGEIITGSHTPRSDPSSAAQAGNRINGAVQWVRTRFNEVLEKAELVRLKLIEAQKRLPEDHPGHPSNHATASKLVGGSSTTDGVVLSSGITAEKLMYDRALEMSRTAAINELANEDLPGCEISYTTAIRMLEAVLENDEDLISRKRSSSLREEKEKSDGEINGINFGDRKDVLKGNSFL